MTEGDIFTLTNPIKINGPWDEGYVLEKHVISSEIIGFYENGNEKFNTIRTELGELMYQFKYNGKKTYISKIMDIIKGDLDKFQLKDKVDIVIPVPPSKKNRSYQPVYIIAEYISNYLNKEYKSDILYKNTNLQAKNGHNTKGTIIKNKDIEKISNVLVIDDIYNSGNTLKNACNVLREDKNVGKIYCLAMTKTKG